MFEVSLLFDSTWSHPFDTDGNPATLEANGHRYDLNDPEQAAKALKECEHQRELLKEGKLSEYEGRGTGFGEGGRTRLLYDELCAKMACDMHAEKHNMTWEEQSAEADRIRGIRAAETHREGKF